MGKLTRNPAVRGKGPGVLALEYHGPGMACFLWVLALLMIFPFIMMIIISFRPAGLAYKPFFYLYRPILANYRAVLGNENFFFWYMNTIVTVVLTIALRMAVTIPAAYAFSRLRFRGRTLILTALMATLMIPGETTMVPRYLFFKQIGLLDSLWVIVLPEISEVFYLMLLTTFFSSIPRDFIEAAQIDGAAHGLVLCKIFVPLSGPTITTLVLFSFIYIWNNFVDPYLFINTTSRQLITPALKYFQERGGANIPVQLAGASLAVLPIIIMFVFTQKFFVAGVSSGGIKG
jgi:multiple sugar transport system permease protein